MKHELIVSLKRVNDDGSEFGGDITFRFSELIAVERMTKWGHVRIERDDGGANFRDVHELVPGCSTIYLGRDQFDVKVEYEELVAKLKEFSEFYG